MRRLVRWLPLLAVGVLVLLSTPWWLPHGLGGDTYYTYILTGSMRGSLDPGTFVVLRPAPEYRIGEVVGYRLAVGEGRSVIIVHRVVDRAANGDYITKGDANRTTETVPPGDVLGRVVFALPYLGYALMVFQAAPHLILLLGVGALVVGSPQTRGPARPFPWFFVALGTVALAAPFASGGLVERFGVVPVTAFLVGMLVVLRLLERQADSPFLRGLVEVNYVLVMALAAAGVPVLQVARELRTFFAG